MSKKEIALWLVLVDFVAFTAWAVVSEGTLAFVPAAWAFAGGSAWGAQIVVDFLIALTVALGFVVTDARRRGLSPWPWVALTCALGSIGLLSYLVRRERRGAASPLPAQTALEHA